ncbi:MAG: hypothetical protein UZ22_OP11002001145 [Microgenomates bacterium OLB23]|nr:MAG: hypothetical protein UZ22_OP11002001145 [Microgenomates bacterium OLB23]
MTEKRCLQLLLCVLRCSYKKRLTYYLDYLERNSNTFANEKSIIPTNIATIKDIVTTVIVSCTVSARVGHVTCFSSSRKPVTNDFGFCIRVLYHISMTPVIFQSIIISLAVFVGFATSLAIKGSYEAIVIALLFIAYFLGKKLLPQHTMHKQYLFDAAIFTTSIVLVVAGSGGITSPLFFLIYFLLFGIGLLVKPLVSLAASITIAILLMYAGSNTPSALATYMSLPLITPFAVLLGSEFNKARMLEQKDAQLRESSLMFLSTVVKVHMKRIEDVVTHFKGDHELDTIIRIVRRTEKLIDKFEKEIEAS